MNFIRRMLSTARSWVSWLLGHQDDPQVLNRNQEYLFPPFVEADHSQPRNQAPWIDEMDEASAIRRTFIPNQSDFQFFHIRPFPENRTMPSSAEHFIFSDDGMQHIDERTVTILAGNEVASPREIGAICVCGKPIRASRVRPCHFCGASLCRACGRYQPVPPGLLDIPVSALILCPTHLKEFRDHWGHWQAAGSSGGPVFLPPHVSIAILDDSTGEES
jgi:hypothetical protein